MIHNPKKAQLFANKVPYYVAVLFILVLLVSLLVYLVFAISNLNVATPKDIRMFLVTQRLISSPQCFAYLSDEHTPSLHVIDSTRFTQQVMETCYPQEQSSRQSIKVTVQDAKGNQIAAIASKNYRTGIIRRTQDIDIYMQNTITRGKIIFEFDHVT